MVVTGDDRDHNKGGIGDNNAIGTTWEAWMMTRNDREDYGA
jgi:hypothetical protein